MHSFNDLVRFVFVRSVLLNSDILALNYCNVSPQTILVCCHFRVDPSFGNAPLLRRIVLHPLLFTFRLSLPTFAPYYANLHPPPVHWSAPSSLRIHIPVHRPSHYQQLPSSTTSKKRSHHHPPRPRHSDRSHLADQPDGRIGYVHKYSIRRPRAT
jgi:hypothetical protein